MKNEERGGTITGLGTALKIAARPESRDKTIVVILPDSGERYLSTQLSDLDE